MAHGNGMMNSLSGSCGGHLLIAGTGITFCGHSKRSKQEVKMAARRGPLKFPMSILKRGNGPRLRRSWRLTLSFVFAVSMITAARNVTQGEGFIYRATEAII